jgi:GntR family transcriptional regulator / MocR family aminotransferase
VAIQWAGLGPELLLRLDRSLPDPLRVQLERELREAIRSGRLAAGERLPSSRELARELGISRGLVLECYAQLGAEGYLTSRGGSATRVADAAQVPPAPAQPAPPPPRFAVDFRPGTPDLNSFPRRDWMWAMRDVLREAPADVFGYGDPRGSRRLREVLVAYLRRVRGTVADPERIVICTGFAQGLNLVVRALARQGVGEMAFEDPGYAEQRDAARLAGLDVAPIPLDAGGIDVDALAATRARAVLLTPAHQSPTGVLLAPERRQALVEWAVERDATILEDDYDAEFRYDREPVGSLQGLSPDRVASLGTVSKSLAPALRLGWIVSPPGLASAITEEKDRDDRGSPVLEQLALAKLIESGRFDRHLRRMRAVYGERRSVLVESLRRHAPQVELRGLAAGFHAVARLPDGHDEQQVVAAAAERSIRLYPMSEYRASGATEPPELVLGFGNLSDGQIERGIAALGELLGSPRPGSRSPRRSRAR